MLFLGVPIFFFISGYLMWKSIDRTPNFKTYFTKRVLRLYPELWCGVAVSLITIFILYDGVVLGEIGLFAVTQSTFLQFWTPDSLRGFGVGTPNGSLWTICVIVQFYIVAWFIKKFMRKCNACGEYKKMIVWVVMLGLMTVIKAISPVIRDLLPGIIGKLYGQTFLPYLWLFMLGAFVCEYFDRIVPLLKRFWWVFAIAFYLLKLSGFEVNGEYPVLTSVLSCAFCLGFAYAFPSLNIKHDFSYGIYIYHMIVINVTLELGIKYNLSVKGNWGVCAIVLLITVLLAVISYFTVGLLSKKKRNTIESKIG